MSERLFSYHSHIFLYLKRRYFPPPDLAWIFPQPYLSKGDIPNLVAWKEIFPNSCPGRRYSPPHVLEGLSVWRPRQCLECLEAKACSRRGRRGTGAEGQVCLKQTSKIQLEIIGRGKKNSIHTKANGNLGEASSQNKGADPGVKLYVPIVVMTNNSQVRAPSRLQYIFSMVPPSLS